MAWTRTTPMQPGRYWFRGIASARPVQKELVELDYDLAGRLNTVSIDSCRADLDWPDVREFLGEWDGPIE
jgi:hypothetical protein